MTERVLYGYYRSSAAYRVRIALNLKGLEYRQQAVNLLQGEQRDPAYLALNPQGLVPALLDGGQLLTQSLAICEYLDEAYPDTPALLPTDRFARARVRALALSICADIHRCIILAYSSIWKPSWARRYRKPDGSVTGLPPALPHWSSNWPVSRHAMPSGIARFAGCLPGAAGVCCAAFRAGSDSVSQYCRIDAALAGLPAFALRIRHGKRMRIGILTSRP
jgi:maleylacetoacetate isomerase/maleylpyruvate isomerase